MDRLIEGYHRFREGIWPGERARYEALAERGQRPETMIVACSDSRVDPQTVFGASPGELFVVRNVAGLIPPYSPDGKYHGTSAALEFGVRVLKVSRLVVLGHAQCGGVQAMVEGAPKEATDFVEEWMAIAEPARRPVTHFHSHDELMLYYETEVVRRSLENAMTFPWIASAVAAGNLALAGFRFGIRTGELQRLEGRRFVPIA